MSGGKKERQKNMTFTKSVFVFAFVVAALLTVTIGLGGPAHVAMLIAAVVAGIVAVSSGYAWDELQEGIGDTIKAAVPAILILLAILVFVAKINRGIGVLITIPVMILSSWLLFKSGQVKVIKEGERNPAPEDEALKKVNDKTITER